MAQSAKSILRNINGKLFQVKHKSISEIDLLGMGEKMTSEHGKSFLVVRINKTRFTGDSMPHMDIIWHKKNRVSLKVEPKLVKYFARSGKPENVSLVCVPSSVPKNQDTILDLYKSFEIDKYIFKPSHRGGKEISIIEEVNPETEFKIQRQVILEIYESLKRMKVSGNPDAQIYANVERLQQFLQKTCDKWIDYHDRDEFCFYEAARDAKLVLDSVKDRIKNAREGAVAKIASDALAVMPTIDDILQAVEGGQDSGEIFRNVSHKTDHLIEAAIGAGLTAALDADAAKIDKEIAASLYRGTITALDKTLFNNDDDYICKVGGARPHSGY